MTLLKSEVEDQDEAENFPVYFLARNRSTINLKRKHLTTMRIQTMHESNFYLYITYYANKLYIISCLGACEAEEIG